MRATGYAVGATLPSEVRLVLLASFYAGCFFEMLKFRVATLVTVGIHAAALLLKVSLSS